MASNEVALSDLLPGVQIGSANKCSAEVGVDGIIKLGRVGATNLNEELLAGVFLRLDRIFFMQHGANMMRMITV